jgi:hypothetical protein
MDLMPAVPIITAVAAVGSAVDQHNQTKKTQKAYQDSLLSYDEAQSRAENSLDSIYDKQLTNTLNALDQSAASRGFYGQAPADAYKRSTASQIETDRASSIADLATQMKGQTAAQAAQQQSLAIQSAQQQANQQYQQALATGYYPTNNLWGTVSNLASNWGSIFGNQQQPKATSGGIGTPVTMDNNGNISWGKSYYGSSPAYNMGSNYGSTDYGGNSGVDFSSILKNGSWKNPLSNYYNYNL